jgi:hypothetical protein
MKIHKIYILVFVVLLLSLLYYMIYGYEDVDHHNNQKNTVKDDKTIKDYIKTAHSGLIRGIILGLLLGDIGIITCIKNAAVFGVVNPIVMYAGY